jgi:23S rRNA (uracil1939-C5)-methyltransferase
MKMRKTKEQPILENVLITDIEAEGKAIARIDGMGLFVPFVVPGDIADIKVIKKKKNYAEGRVVEIKHYSEKRAELQCPHFGTCGGCRWQNLQYQFQLEAKQQQVRDNLERLGHVDCTQMQPICGSDKTFYYRNKLEYTFSTKAWHEQPPTANTPAEPGALGFHIPSLFDKVLNIEHCALQEDLSNQIRLAVRDYAIEHELPFYDIRNHTGCLRNLIIRNTSTGQWMVVLVIAEYHLGWEGLMEHLRDSFPQITSLQYILNDKLNDSYADLPSVTFAGQNYVEEVMDGYQGATPLHFTIRPQTFYQTNSAQAQKLYSFVAQYADLTPDDVVYDLYTGTGTIALFLARMCKHIVGIEYVEDSIAAARQNALQNHINNTEFHAGDMAKVLTPQFVAEHGRPDVVVTDPPRAGMHPDVVKTILRAAPKRIVYVSCNPATQARDLHDMDAHYRVVAVQPVDMFPHTPHVENVVLLERR